MPREQCLLAMPLVLACSYVQQTKMHEVKIPFGAKFCGKELSISLTTLFMQALGASPSPAPIPATGTSSRRPEKGKRKKKKVCGASLAQAANATAIYQLNENHRASNAWWRLIGGDREREARHPPSSCIKE